MTEPSLRDLPLIRFEPDRQRRFAAGHPWAYSNEIAMSQAAKALSPGTLVRLESSHAEPLGLALFNPRSLIAARGLSRAPDALIDGAFFTARIARALDLRERLFDRPYYRLIHAEADGLPGLVVDRYGDKLAVQINSAGMELLAAPLIDGLRATIAPRTMVIRRDSAARTLEGLTLAEPEILGDPDTNAIAVENDCRFAIDLGSGQKTGWFYDQRPNRAAVARLARGASVLDVFCYLGGFGLEAARAGAAHVRFVDRSKSALEGVRAAAALNDLTDRIDAQIGDGVEMMEAIGQTAERFDIVVADPPAFVKSKKDLGVGLRAYRRMARAGAACVKPGGFLLVASCSHNVAPDIFADEVRAALSRAQRRGRIIMTGGAGPDHPVHPFLPESAYLKAILLQLD